MPTTCSPAGWPSACSTLGASARRPSRPASGSSTTTTPTSAGWSEDADALLLIGQAAERYAWATFRGEDLAEQLNDVINEIYEGALQADPHCWQAAWLEGRLFLNGYREGDAKKELNRALLINPSAVEVIVTLGRADLQGYKLADGRQKAEDALAVNPHYGPAYVLLADLNISDERFADALDAVEEGRGREPQGRGRPGPARRVVPACWSIRSARRRPRRWP